MRYERPDTLNDAVRLLSQASDNSFVLAGGTDLLVRMKSDEFAPDLLVDIKSIQELSEIVEAERGITIGAAVPCAKLGQHAGLRKSWQGVVEAANLIGSTQIQSRCTIVGNLCNASPAADSVPALVAANARAKIAGPDGTRVVSVEDLLTGPGTLAIETSEIVEAIVLEKLPERSGDAYLRFIPRTEMDIAVVGAGIKLTLDGDGVVESARVALGAVAPTVLLVEAAAEAIVGSRLDDAALDGLAAACSAACNPIDDKRGTVEFRTKVAGVLARRAARIAYDRAGVA